ncbi:hypothetical protein KVT40_009355 [Elsinoe batatas]|uniref:Uncharacterized protein n=1 Tax=Elsinoe batatas TaxID=2601811 RepID=A0A8K0PES5_9PEZI|nr:hypothetical protein KVT40_009355 [Elsinoe batatas]
MPISTPSISGYPWDRLPITIKNTHVWKGQPGWQLLAQGIADLIAFLLPISYFLFRTSPWNISAISRHFGPVGPLRSIYGTRRTSSMLNRRRSLSSSRDIAENLSISPDSLLPTFTSPISGYPWDRLPITIKNTHVWKGQPGWQLLAQGIADLIAFLLSTSYFLFRTSPWNISAISRHFGPAGPLRSIHGARPTSSMSNRRRSSSSSRDIAENLSISPDSLLPTFTSTILGYPWDRLPITIQNTHVWKGQPGWQLLAQGIANLTAFLLPISYLLFRTSPWNISAISRHFGPVGPLRSIYGARSTSSMLNRRRRPSSSRDIAENLSIFPYLFLSTSLLSTSILLGSRRPITIQNTHVWKGQPGWSLRILGFIDFIALLLPTLYLLFRTSLNILAFYRHFGPARPLRSIYGARPTSSMSNRRRSSSSSRDTAENLSISLPPLRTPTSRPPLRDSTTLLALALFLGPYLFLNLTAEQVVGLFRPRKSNTTKGSILSCLGSPTLPYTFSFWIWAFILRKLALGEPGRLRVALIPYLLVVELAHFRPFLFWTSLNILALCRHFGPAGPSRSIYGTRPTSSMSNRRRSLSSSRDIAGNLSTLRFSLRTLISRSFLAEMGPFLLRSILKEED